MLKKNKRLTDCLQVGSDHEHHDRHEGADSDTTEATTYVNLAVADETERHG